jgi:alpha-tubulin suppressor-like RCC1 family protein
MTEQETIMTGVSAIAAGSRYNCALMNNGGVRCWGANHFGQHGNGLRRNQATADWVLDESMTPISNAVALSAGYRHNLILTEQGEVWSWGDKSYAAPGDGSGGYPETDEVDYEAVGTRLVAGPVLFIQ